MSQVSTHRTRADRRSNAARRRSRLVGVLGVIAFLALLLAISGADEANAYCDGASSSKVRSGPYANEMSRWSSTCDDELDYYGKVSDTLTDGYCVRMAFTVAGVWNYSEYECTLNDWTNYVYYDDDGHSWMKFCKSSGGGCSSYWTNHGF